MFSFKYIIHKRSRTKSCVPVWSLIYPNVTLEPPTRLPYIAIGYQQVIMLHLSTTYYILLLPILRISPSINFCDQDQPVIHRQPASSGDHCSSFAQVDCDDLNDLTRHTCASWMTRDLMDILFSFTGDCGFHNFAMRFGDVIPSTLFLSNPSPVLKLSGSTLGVSSRIAPSRDMVFWRSCSTQCQIDFAEIGALIKAVKKSTAPHVVIGTGSSDLSRNIHFRQLHSPDAKNIDRVREHYL